MSTQGFDASSVKRSTWIAGGGAVVLLLSTFFAGGRSRRLGFSVNASGWDTGALGKLVFFVALIAIIARRRRSHEDRRLADARLHGAAVCSASRCAGGPVRALRFIDTPDHVTGPGASTSR